LIRRFETRCSLAAPAENACRYIERVQDRPIQRRMAETVEELREIEEEVYRDHADPIAPARVEFDKLKIDIQEYANAIAERAISELAAQWREYADPIWGAIADDLVGCFQHSNPMRRSKVLHFAG
jgi:hypothetical protein